MSSELMERIEKMKLAVEVPCGDPTIRMQCYVCSALRPKGVECGLENTINLHRTEGYCATSDEGKKCGKCTHLCYEMDGCVHNGFVAAMYRLIMNIKEDDRKFEPSPEGDTALIMYKQP